VLAIAAGPLWAEGDGDRIAEIKISSPAFDDGGILPAIFGYNYDNMSPPLRWSQIPRQTKSIALICEDPDAPYGNWTHWILFNISPRMDGLPEGVPKEDVVLGGAMQGINDFRKIGYDGPAPPKGVHRYYFKIYALDQTIDLEPGIGRKELLKKIEGHIIGQGAIMGRFKR
jgi:Raf kinase inhibitor-like YbhB/YbcL family protein